MKHMLGVPTRGRPRSQTGGALVPAAARTPTKLTAEEQALAGDAIETFTRAVGGRKKLLDTLAVAGTDSASGTVVAMLLDPEREHWSLRRICHAAGITVADLFANYKRALFTQAHIEATHIIAARLPPIVEDVMTRAAPSLVPCRRCYGAPTTSGTSDCPACHGTGEVLSEPDIERQKLALELGKLTAQHKAGVLVQQNVNAAAALTAQGTGSLEQLQQVVGDLLFAPGRRRSRAPTIEASVVADAQVVADAPPVETSGETNGGEGGA